MPYDGFDHRVTLVVMLGAAVLLLDAAAVLGFAPRRISDARRATAALPLIALAVVPSTLVHPAAPSLQGLLLFVLVAFFVWGERLRFDGGRAALALLATAGLAAAVVAPLINGGKAWFDYQKWAGTTSIQHLASFQWNQTYGPLRWPQKGSRFSASAPRRVITGRPRTSTISTGRPGCRGRRHSYRSPARPGAR